MKPNLYAVRPWIILIGLACLALLIFFVSFSPFAYASVPAVGITPTLNRTIFAEGLDEPVDLTHAGDSRLFVAEQKGTIRIVEADGTVVTTPFLDITDRVEYSGTPGTEQGLLGLTFDPDFANNGYFYVHYSFCTVSDCPDFGATPNLYTRISRFTVSADPQIANPGSELVLLTIQQPYGEHNGGDLNFGPDGYLYIGMGDGGNENDPENRAQNGLELLGKMLRMDVNGGGLPPECDPLGNYTIPADNPFLSAPNTCNEIWAFGLRNPWRFSFDRLTGDLFMGDVGEQGWEEINFQPASSPGGENWGWRCYEGNHAYLTDGCGPIENYDFPIFEYAQTTVRCAVVSGYVYRGGQFPALYGHYIFADYCKGDFWTAHFDGSWNVTAQGDLGNHFYSFGENADGEIFISASNGRIYHIIETTTMLTPTALPSPTITPTPTPLVNLTPVASGFQEPLDVENAGDERLFVAERGGTVYEVAGNGSVNPTPFLDISDRVTTTGDQQGLLSLAFHPDFANNGYLYTHYTGLNGDLILARYTHSGTFTTTQPIDPATELLILSIDHPDSSAINNGGELAFGPDGYLYLSLGDGGDHEAAQNIQSLLGKVLRLDVDSASPYAIPADNPFVGVANAREEIWTLGLRNPWRYSFDRVTGDLYLGDVGGTQREEIDFLPASSMGGENFGWSCYEGSTQGPGYDPGACNATYIPPLHEYNHTVGAAVVGGYVYRGCQYSDMTGKYYFADFVSSALWSLKPDGLGGFVLETLSAFTPLPFSSFGQGYDGELYTLGYVPGTDTGILYHLAGNGSPNCYVSWLPLVERP